MIVRKQPQNNSPGKNEVEVEAGVVDSCNPTDDSQIYFISGTDTPCKESVNKYKEEMRKRRNITGKLYCCRCAIDRLQSIYLPIRFSTYFPVPTSDSEEDLTRGNIHPPGRIPIVSGLERVITGEQPASEAVHLCGMKPIRYLWYMLSGFLCDIIQFFIDVALLLFLNIEDPSYCWALGFAISILFRHTSHRYFIFGDYVGGYWNSLMRMYGGYSIIILISTIFNIVMTKVFKLHHYVAWVITLLWTGIVNYFILKKLWSFDNSSSSPTKLSSERHHV